jgi:hypothetical protein
LSAVHPAHLESALGDRHNIGSGHGLTWNLHSVTDAHRLEVIGDGTEYEY